MAMKSTVALSVLYILAVIFVSAKAESKTKSCNDVKEAYSSKGFNVNDVPNKGVHGKFHHKSFSLTVLHIFFHKWLF